MADTAPKGSVETSRCQAPTVPPPLRGPGQDHARAQALPTVNSTLGYTPPPTGNSRPAPRCPGPRVLSALQDSPELRSFSPGGAAEWAALTTTTPFLPASVLGGWTVPRTVRLPMAPPPPGRQHCPGGLQVPPAAWVPPSGSGVTPPGPSHSDLIQEWHMTRTIPEHTALGDRGRKQAFHPTDEETEAWPGDHGRALAMGQSWTGVHALPPAAPPPGSGSPLLRLDRSRAPGLPTDPGFPAGWQACPEAHRLTLPDAVGSAGLELGSRSPQGCGCQGKAPSLASSPLHNPGRWAQGSHPSSLSPPRR